MLFLGKTDHRDRNPVLHHRFQPENVIRVQMRQDYCVWDQTARPQETAQGAVSLSRIKDIHFVLIPEDRRVSIPGTELDVFRGRMMDGKKGYNDNRRSDEQQESPKRKGNAVEAYQQPEG